MFPSMKMNRPGGAAGSGLEGGSKLHAAATSPITQALIEMLLTSGGNGRDESRHPGIEADRNPSEGLRALIPDS